MPELKHPSDLHRQAWAEVTAEFRERGVDVERDVIGPLDDGASLGDVPSGDVDFLQAVEARYQELLRAQGGWRPPVARAADLLD